MPRDYWTTAAARAYVWGLVLELVADVNLFHQRRRAVPVVRLRETGMQTDALAFIAHNEMKDHQSQLVLCQLVIA